MTDGHAGRQRAWLYALLGVVVVIVVAQARLGITGSLLGDSQHTFDTWGTDDAYIAFRYAWNVAHGWGLAYNPGQPPVEGYSSLGFVALLWPFALLGKQYVYAGALATCLIGYLAFIVLSGELAVLRVGDWARWPVRIVVALCPSFWAWSNSGLETMLMAAVQTALLVGVLRRSQGGGLGLPCLAAAACVVMRADGFVLPVLACAWLVWRDRNGAATVLAVVGSCLALLTIWRLGYYGWPLPNTVYAKVAGEATYRLRNASVDFLAFLLTGSLAAVVATAGEIGQNVLEALRAARAGRFDLRVVSFEAFVVGGWLAYFFYLGGDVYIERFLLFLVPLMSLAMLRLTGSRHVRMAVAVLLACQLVVVAYDHRLRVYADKRNTWFEVGQRLRDASAGHDWLLAIDAAGEVPYVSDLQTLDMLGLNDAHIAHLPAIGNRVGHMKYDLPYVLAQSPHWIAGFQETPEQRDLAWGLDEPVYLKAGYRIRFLGWSAPSFPPSEQEMVVDVADRSLGRISELMNAGYGFVVLERGQ